MEALAESWGAQWQQDGDGGRLTVPVVAGLRRGFNEGLVTITKETGGSNVRFVSQREELRLHRSAAIILVFGGFGGLCCVLWPFSPALLALAPVGFVLAFMSWLMITSKLRMSSPADFLEDLVSSHEGRPGS